jgi:general secretion pathway protein C
MWQLQPAQPIMQWQPPAAPIAKQTKSGSKKLQPDDIISANIFGRYDAQPQPMNEKENKIDAPTTDLALKLVGVVLSSNKKLSLAVVDNEGKQSTYGVGETIEQTHAVVKVIAKDRIIIANTGRDEAVILEGSEEIKKNATRTPSKKQPIVIAENLPQDARDKFEKIRSKINANPSLLFNYIRLLPEHENGELIGYRPTPAMEPDFFAAIGFKPGDVIVAINGASVGAGVGFEDLIDEQTQTVAFTIIRQEGDEHVLTL